MRIRAVLALSVTIILFSTFEVVSKSIAGFTNPMQVNFLRFFIAGMALLPLAVLELRGKGHTLQRRDWAELSWLGILNVTICLMAFQISIQYIPASAAAVIFCTNPVFVHVTEALVHRTRPSVPQILGLAVSLSGLGCIFADEMMNGSGSWLGFGLALFAAVTYGIYIFMAKGAGARLGVLTANALSFLIGAAASIPFLLYFKVPIFQLNPSAWPELLYLSLAVTCVAYVAFVYGLQHLPAGSGSLIFFVKPLLATLLAFWFLSENISPLFILGAFIIIAGLGLYQLQKPDATH